MVDLSGIGRNLNTDPLAAAQAAQAAGRNNKTEQKAKVRPSRGLGLADIPEEAPYIPVSNDPVLEELQTETVGETDQAEEAGLQALQELDYELVALQALIKKAIARKIELADKHDDRKHELLTSAFNDCKNAYQKIEAVRRTLQG
jgi:hypothetical protein